MPHAKPKLIHADPRTLRPNTWNTNVVSPENELKIEESIKRFGVFKPILVREHDGFLEILGGEHRARVAMKLGYKEVPVLNLGPISTKEAKEIGLVDNGRYGEDDSLQLSALLRELGDVSEIESYLPYSSEDLSSIFSTSSIALDDLDMPEDDSPIPELPTSAPPMTHQLMRFKVPVGDAMRIQELIEKTMASQGYTSEDSYSNAGNALVHLLGKAGTW
jgi:ParB-like chromosome segregation protein Spo0J